MNKDEKNGHIFCVLSMLLGLSITIAIINEKSIYYHIFDGIKEWVLK